MTSISIAMGTYNGATYLPEQLESLLAQTTVPIELIVGDDGSTDNTLAILKDFSGRAPFPVMVASNPKRLGYGENFIQTASRCTGEWIAFCDQDDVWLPSKLAKCAEAMNNGPADLALIVHGAIAGDSELNEIARLEWPRAGLYSSLSLPPDWLVPGFRQVVRRSLLNEIPFENRHIPWIGEPEAHDAWSCLIASVTGSVAVLADCLAVYRRHDTNTTEEFGLVRRTLAHRLFGKVRDNSAAYQERASRYSTIAAYLVDRSKEQMTPKRRDQFLSASTQIGKYAERMTTRAQINAEISLPKRVRAYLSLARSGAYSRKDAWGFGTAEATVDLVRVALPKLGRT